MSSSTLLGIQPGDEGIESWVKRSRSFTRIQKIPGDASTRRYYRVFTDKSSYIVMRAEPFADQGMQYPFLLMQKHLALSGVDVPSVLDVDASQGFILLEDLGDVTVLRRLQEVSNPEVERHIFESVIDSLVHLHVNASPERWPSSRDKNDAFKLRFDHEKLMWEVNYCIEHFYEGYLKRKITASDREVMVSGFSEICTLLANEPTVLTHRDFHTRNVMVCDSPKADQDAEKPPRFVMIDFQDARMGPAQYDLASLLKDSYYQLEEKQIQMLIDYYVAKVEAASGARIDRNQFRMLFDMMGIQRNFKAIGSFSSFLVKRGDAGYLKFIGNTFENIRRGLLNYPQYSQLREVLFHYYYF